MDYKEKAQNNLAAAQFLINQQCVKYYAPSVHCSYYAVFQYMKYMLAHATNNPLTYERQKENAYANKSDSHVYILGEIEHRIDKRKDAIEFAIDVRDLKRRRVSADYEINKITLDESLECIKCAEGLIARLKRYFGNL